MNKQIIFSIYLNIFNFVTTAYLEAESNYLKPKLERNNIVNKGLWIRNKEEQKFKNDFIFRANSLDVDDVQNNNNIFGENSVANPLFFSGYVERNKRSINDKREKRQKNNAKCENVSNCINANDNSPFFETKFISTLKPASVFNDYPYEVAVLLNSKKVQLTEFPVQEIEIYNQDGVLNTINYKTTATQRTISSMDNDNTSLKRSKNLTYSLIRNEKGLKTNNKNRTFVIPKRSMEHEYSSELINKIELENFNATESTIHKLDRNVFDKEDMAWPDAVPSNINVYKILPKTEENKRNKPMTERGLIKLLSMLTKTFKKIMKQHHEIKRIHNKLYNLNDDFLKNAETFAKKFEDFNSKYSFMMKLNEELKVMQTKLQQKEKSFDAREKNLSQNLKEFETQQKKFLAQQRQFYNVQQLMLEQNEKINLKQNLIAKTQSEISHRQNNFARILKKGKQIYIDSKNVIPTKLNTGIAKPKIKPANEEVEHSKIIPTTTTTSASPTTETVKINLFSIPTLSQLKNQDQMILDEKDDQPVDDLIYKYYFNNTFIDDLMKTKILATFVTAAEGVDNNNTKNKRNYMTKLKTTLLVPVNKTIKSTMKHRNRRWIKHHKKNHINKDLNVSPTPVNQRTNYIKEHIVNASTQTDISNKKGGPFITMALSFCKEIGQNTNLQVLNWCVEKALRRLQVIDSNISPLMTPPMSTTDAANISHNEINSSRTETSTNRESQRIHQQPVTTDAATKTFLFFPDNDELESKLKEYELKPDTEGAVYYDGSLHASDIERIGQDSEGFSDIMPGLDSNSRVQVDPMAFDLQSQRRADVRKINERIMKMAMV